MESKPKVGEDVYTDKGGVVRASRNMKRNESVWATLDQYHKIQTQDSPVTEDEGLTINTPQDGR